MKERLQQAPCGFPYPAFLSIGFVVLFSCHVLFGLNPRLGYRADIPTLQAAESHEGTIWFSVHQEGHKIYLTTSDKHIFSWSSDAAEKTKLDEFIAYLKKQLEGVAISTALDKQVLLLQTVVVLAVDKSLEYAQLRPIIYAFAQAGISHYAFEVKRPLLVE
jgi:hypothetical protein